MLAPMSVTSRAALLAFVAMRTLRTVIVGAGFAGLGLARDLQRAGLGEVVVLERAEDVGGVWRENTYPGAACDVPSPLYSWSWAPNESWPRRYSGQRDILEYIRRTAAEEGLLDLVRTGTTVTGATWTGSGWQVHTEGGPTYDADVLVMATGQLSEPLVPDLPGAGDFEGPAFHSARWRHDVDLAGKRVAVVGTGASVIQLVPGIVDDVADLTVFQRSAPYVVPKPDRAYTAAHHRLFRRVPAALRAERALVYRLSEVLNAAVTHQRRWSPAMLGAIRLAWRLHLRRQVRDRSLRRVLVPSYPVGCKRLLFSNDWYPALDRDHVAVVDRPVAAVEARGVRTDDGVLHEADVLVWGTGFRATDFVGDLEVTGPDGRTLREAWAGGARAHLGIGVAGFPNLFCLYGPNTNLGGSSIIGMLEAQSGYVTELVRALAEGRATALSPRAEVYDAFDEEMQRRLRDTAWSQCSNWYVADGRNSTNWPGLVEEYKQRTAEVDWAELEDPIGNVDGNQLIPG
jgi:cation diffusion facilitator CzcD-associated flavoprotein CzcO